MPFKSCPDDIPVVVMEMTHSKSRSCSPNVCIEAMFSCPAEHGLPQSLWPICTISRTPQPNVLEWKVYTPFHTAFVKRIGFIPDVVRAAIMIVVSAGRAVLRFLQWTSNSTKEKRSRRYLRNSDPSRWDDFILTISSSGFGECHSHVHHS